MNQKRPMWFYIVDTEDPDSDHYTVFRNTKDEARYHFKELFNDIGMEFPENQEEFDKHLFDESEVDFE